MKLLPSFLILRYCLKHKLDQEKGVSAIAALEDRVHVAVGDGLGRILLVQASGDAAEQQQRRLVATRVHWHSLPVASLREEGRHKFIDYFTVMNWL